MLLMFCVHFPLIPLAVQYCSNGDNIGLWKAKQKQKKKDEKIKIVFFYKMISRRIVYYFNGTLLLELLCYWDFIRVISNEWNLASDVYNAIF